MIEDLVINSYKEQIKESVIKAKAIDVAGFSVIVEELKRRGIDTKRVLDYFNKMKLANTHEELDNLTVEELDEITLDINKQVTRALISPVEMSDLVIRKSKIIARDMSVDGKVLDNDKFIKIGANLAAEIEKHGIASGLNTCIKNYCIQKLYQQNYKEKIREKEKELGIENTTIEKSKTVKKVDSKKDKTLKDIFKKSVEYSNLGSFDVIKNNYLEYLGKIVDDLKSYK